MNTVRRLLPYVRPYRLRFVQAALAMLAVALFNGAAVYLLKPLVDKIFISKDVALLRGALVLLPVLFVLKAVASYVQNYLMTAIGQQAVQRLRADLFRHLHSLPLEFFWRNRAAEVLSRVTSDLTNVQSFLQFIPLYLIRDSLTVVFLLIVLVALNWKLAMVALFGMPFAALTLGKLGRKMRDSSTRSQVLMADLYHRFQESLQGMAVIKAFNYEPGAIERFERENQWFLDQMMRYLRASALSSPLMELLGGLILTGLVYVAGREILAGTLSPGAFFAFLGCFFAAYAPVKNLAKMNSDVQRGLASAERVFELLDEKPSAKEPARPAPFSGLREVIELRGLGFRYPERERWALRGVDLSIRRGQTVALVGPSGSGKSTLAGLLLRLLEPQEGRILIDGADLAELDVRAVREHVGLVSQETVLFHDTVAANVALGRPATEAQIREACRVADADAFIRELPRGYDTVLGDRGLKLSGGQRQRLAIARALLRNPALLILDEATSNLDSQSEAAVQGALARLMEGRTVVVIAHRLSTVQGADKIFVLNQGELVETGSHAELLAAGGVYQKLYEMQRLEAAAPEPQP